jgi:hypothetical protein
MDTFREEIRVFLERFEANTNLGSPEEIVTQFADVFMVADPSGARAVPSSVLLMAIPQRRKLFADIGSSVTTLASVKETRLDDRYVLLKTEWLVKFEREDGLGEELILRSTFLVYRSDVGLKVVFYLSHEDLMSVLRERRLLLSDTA